MSDELISQSLDFLSKLEVVECTLEQTRGVIAELCAALSQQRQLTYETQQRCATETAALDTANGALKSALSAVDRVSLQLAAAQDRLRLSEAKNDVLRQALAMLESEREALRRQAGRSSWQVFKDWIQS